MTNTIMTNTITGVRTIHDGWSQLLVATIRRADGGTITREIEDHGAAVGLLPYDPERRVAMLVRQFRAPAAHAAGADDVLEVPAGLIEGEDPTDCALRELEEETGLRLSRVERLGTVWSMPGISTERMHLFLAPYGTADRIGQGGGVADEHEETVMEEIALSELAARPSRGALEVLAAGRILGAHATIELWMAEAARARRHGG